MARINCKSCGASVNTAFYICPHCGVKRADRELLKDVNVAYNADDSEAARLFYKKVLTADPVNAEAYWGLFLLDYGVKDSIYNDGIAQMRVPADFSLLKNLTAELYESIVSNGNYRTALEFAAGDFKTRVDAFSHALEERYAKLKPQYGKRDDAVRNYFSSPSPATSDDEDGFNNNVLPKGENFFSKPDNAAGARSGKSADAEPKRTSGISAGKWVATVLCCLPVILELLVVFLIPHIGVLAKNTYVARWGWQALSLPLKISFLSVIVLGFAIQALGLFGKLHNVLGMFTQIISFGLFVLSAYALYGNASPVYTQWGLAMVVPVSLLVAALRYMSADGFGFIDDFNFWYYLPIALEVAEYILFFLVFCAIFGVSASLWFFVAITVTTVASVAVSSFWEDFHWAPVGINLAVAVLLCVVFWIGKLISSEWFWNGGVITVVILAIGASWFIHWWIHRNDP